MVSNDQQTLPPQLAGARDYVVQRVGRLPKKGRDLG
jgi:hypothetical protein